MNDPDGKVVVITGASSGIGEEGAVALARRGHVLRLVARREDELARVRERIEEAGGVATVHPCDLSELDTIDALAKDLLSVGPVDVLVNNAGRSIRRPIAEAIERDRDFEKVMELNYLAAVRLTSRLLPGMLERRDGHLVMVSSQSAIAPVPRYAAYAASKCALEGFTRSVATELRNDGITATILNYPLVRTPMVAPTKLYQSVKMMPVEKAAEWMVRAVEDRPARVSDMRGRAFAVALAAAPGPTINAAGWFFDRYAARLAKRLT